MKRFLKLVVLAMAINFVILVLSIWLFHDERSLFHSVRVGSELSVDTFEGLKGAGECRFFASGTYRVCYFRDFWYHYKVFIDQQGTITYKRRTPARDLANPSSFLPERYQSLIYVGLIVLLLAAVGGSIWFVNAGRPQTAPPGP